MKTIFNIAISIALGCSCASCSDFLNLTPYSEITAELEIILIGWYCSFQRTFPLKTGFRDSAK